MVLIFVNHFQLVRWIFSFFFMFLSWVWIENSGVPKNKAFVSSCLNSLQFSTWIVFQIEIHGFQVWKPFSTCTFIFFFFLYVFFMSLNRKWWGSVTYNIRVFIFEFPSNHCRTSFWNRSSWFSRLKPFPTCTLIFFFCLYVSFMSLNRKWWGSVKYNIHVFMVEFPSI